MEAARCTSRSASHENGPSGNYSKRPRAGGERDSIANGASIRGTDENRAPSDLPRAFQGMLKTTTETGDIGMFSIKPSRVPQPLNTQRRIGGTYQEHGAQKTRSNFLPYGVPSIDDRRRLPSYARDASSEVISMYETASQKSASQGFDDPGYRSYSLTQTSYSSFTLSNHRSYTSLRSQPDGNGVLQRPRSPFAYPTRLKRPGFRPSSPALTGGGAVDYSRRAEIDRAPHGAGRGNSSPSSLYAQKRKPPLSLRADANRSTPSLLSQASPQRRSPSPNAQKDTETPDNDRPHGNGRLLGNTSPARSTISLASTVNLYQAAPVRSTPGKLHPPSPLYYDYTEDFDVDDYNQPEPLEPPPQFKIDKTIPEDRPLSANWPPADSADNRRLESNIRSGTFVRTLVVSIAQEPQEGPRDSSKQFHSKATSQLIQESAAVDPPPPEGEYSDKPVSHQIDKKVIRLSGLGVRARELSTHVEEVFGLLPSSSFEIILPSNQVDKITCQDGADVRSGHGHRDIETSSNRTPNSRLSANFSQFRDSDQLHQSVPIAPEADSESPQYASQKQDDIMSALSDASTSHGTNGRFLSPSRPARQDINGSLPTRSASAGTGRRSSRVYAVDTGLNELTDLNPGFGETNWSRSPIDKKRLVSGPRRTPMTYPTLQNESLVRRASSDHSIAPQLSSIKWLEVGNVRKVASEQTLKRSHHHNRGQEADTITVPSRGESEIPNFSHQFPRNVISRSGTPMLAPKPISPARQLKLKNSIPQLMKALPPLPPEPVAQEILSPCHFTSPESELPCKFAPLIPEATSSPGHELQPIPESEQVPHHVERTLPQAIEIPHELLEPAELDSIPVQIPCAQLEERPGKPSLHVPPPKLKLKMRNSAASRPMSPPDSRPWNLEESYPWSNQDVNVGLPPLLQVDKDGHSKPPKFKLKITRASNSTLGTVRVNRESADSKHLGLHLRHPKDLFTSPSGIDTIFRQVSRHLHTRKASLNSTHQSIENKSTPISIPTRDQNLESRDKSSDPDIPQPSTMCPNPLSPTDVKSFFSDDSSHIQSGHHSLRKRLSNFRARMAVPYSSRNGSHSYDDILWRDRNGAQAPTPPAARSIPDLQNTGGSSNTRSLRRFKGRVHTKKLRLKVSGWLKEARSAIVARMKSCSPTRSGDEDQVQLTAML